MPSKFFGPIFLVVLAAAAVCRSAAGQQGSGQTTPSDSIVYKVQLPKDRLELTVNASRILTLEQKIPRAQVGNKDLLDITPIAENQLLIHAKKIGFTEINIWDEHNKQHLIEIAVFGDVKELANVLKVHFPTATIRIFPTGNSVILSGYVDRADHISQIVDIAKDYSPKVINYLTVGGVQQVLLHVQIMEVSRSKLRDLGIDFAEFNGDSFVRTSVVGLLSGSAATGITTSGQENLAFGIVNPNNSFFGVLAALRKNELAKVLAEPTLVTVSGRPAYFQAGGQVPVPIPQSLGTISIEYHNFGTQVDFVPIVLGNGNVRLEVRPQVSEVDFTLGTVLNGSVVPGFKIRVVDTAVELKVGQTLALCGLIQNRLEAENTGLPWVSDMPYLGAAFRRTREKVNEIELLILVRPELVEGVDPSLLTGPGPGMSTMSPTDCQLHFQGRVEVPNPVFGSDSGPNQGAEDMRAPMRHAEPLPRGSSSAADSLLPTPPQPLGAAADMRNNVPSTTLVSRGTSISPSNRANSSDPQGPSRMESSSDEPAFLGPLGYDVENREGKSE